MLELTCLECSEKILNIDKSDHDENGYFCDLDCSEKFIINKVQKVNRNSFYDEGHWLYSNDSKYYDYRNHDFIVLPHGRSEGKTRK